MLQPKVCGDDPSPYQAPMGLMQALAPAGEKRTVKRGARLFSFGDAAEGAYLIVSGTARASLAGEEGRELVCRTAGPGAVLGLPSALCATQYHFDVEALETVEAVFLRTETVNDILRQHPELCMQVMGMMCGELDALKQTTDHMRSCGKRSCSLQSTCRQACPA